jgi:hypothetical protein
MIKKLLCIGLALALVLCAGLVWYSNQIIKHKDQVTCEMLSYKEKEIRLENMQKTLLTLYNISPYEAKYYSYIFDDFSQKYNLPWEAYPALIRIESNFNSGVMSKDRAKGMTQVLESTGKTQAQKLGIPFNEGTLWNCVLNMVIGFDFFSEGYAEKINETSKDSALKHAMKRYCGGPGYATINPDARVYVKEYRMTLWEEYLRISYVYKGIIYDQLMTSMERKKHQEFYCFTALLNIYKVK